MNDRSELFASQREHFATHVRYTTATQRIASLRRLRAWIWQHQSDIQEAIYRDLRKPACEVDLSDIKPVLTEIREVRHHLHQWMQPRTVATPLFLATTSARITRQPKGVSLILAPWNFPFNLSVGPLVSAVAAGNCVVLKPSELSPHTSALIKTMVEAVFDRREVAVCLGDASVATELLKLPFDHIFFTGSPEVGKIVMHAAASNLASVTLELGGRNPVLVDDTADIFDTAEKLVWGKFLNTGQSCVSPNYVLVQRQVHAPLVEAIRAAFLRLYGDPRQVASSPDYGRIINARHCQRVSRLIADSVAAGAQVVLGGEVRAEDNYVAPTILDRVPLTAAVMREEIFGPILPIVEVDSLRDAVAIVNAGDKPLALYVFSTSPGNIHEVLASTSSGGVCINDTSIQFMHPGLPFGGVNWSGLGQSHGKAGFMQFTHERPVLEQRRGFTTAKMVYPPFTGLKKALIQVLTWWL